MNIRSDGKLSVNHYDIPLNGTINQTERALITDIDGMTPPTPDGHNFLDLIWTKPYFITFCIKTPDWGFYHKAQDGHDAVVFLSEKEKITGAAKKKQFYDPNYSFFNAMTVNNIPDRRAIRITNYHRQNAEGDPIPSGQKRNYCFEIYLEAPFFIGGEKLTVLIDPDGQNQGPGGI
jgi:hypothetical protein